MTATGSENYITEYDYIDSNGKYSNSSAKGSEYWTFNKENYTATLTW